MTEVDQAGRLRRRLARKDSNRERIAADVIKSPDLLTEVLDGLESDEATVRYGSAKVIRTISEREPELLYPHLDFFVERLDCENQVMQWEAIAVLGNLARVDTEGTIDRLLDRYLGPIRGPVMITAANTIKGAVRIALAKPDLTEPIVKAILRVERGKYKTPECRNVAIGHALEAFGELDAQLDDAKAVLSFATRQLKNGRQSTRRKAERFLKRRERRARARTSG